jgi:hypothetical protein
MTLSSVRTASPAALFVLTMVLAVVFLAVANYGIIVTHTGNGGTQPYLFTLALTAVVSAALLFWALSRPGADAARWSLALGILAFVLLPVFWSGLSFAFGVAAVAFGMGRADRAARAGLYLGAAAAVLAAIGCVALA